MPVVTKREFETLETGAYAATVASITQIESQFKDQRTGQPQQQFQWDFDLVDGGSQRGWTGITMSSRSNFGKWVRAIMGEIPDTLDTDDLIGKPCRLSIVVKTRDDGTEYNKIDNVLAPRQGQVAAKRKPQPEMVADEEVLPF